MNKVREKPSISSKTRKIINEVHQKAGTIRNIECHMQSIPY